MTAAVETISPDADAIGDWSAPEGSEPWAKALRVGLQRCVDKVGMYPDELRALVKKAEQFVAWTKLLDRDGKPFPTFDAFCLAKKPFGLGTPYEKLKPYLLAAHGGDAVKLAAMTTRPEAAPRPGGKRAGAGRKVPPPVEAKENQEVRQENQAQHTAPEKKLGGGDTDRIAARIARDAPEVLEEMKAGKYSSVRAAAKAAGIVKDRAPDSVRLAVAAVAKVPFQRLAELACALPIETRRGLLACLKDSLS